MPIYTYECAEHGCVDDIRSFADADRPAICPTCGNAAPRTVTIPALRTLDHATRTAMSRNERSRHEPKVVKRGHQCGSGCNHSHHKKQEKPASPGLKNYGGPRPWVIEHPR